jgi:cell division septum initiation protein DivIVA
MDLDSVADELYGLVPGQFTRRRDALALAARRAGDRDLAATIKALRRPTTSAWLANVLVRERPDQLADLVELGETMRQAQADLAGADLRRLSQQRHRVVAALAGEARGLAGNAGEPLSNAAAKELEDTLAAAIFDAGAAGALCSGRLTTSLRYSGIGPVDLTGAVGPLPASGATRELVAPLRQRGPDRPSDGGAGPLPTADSTSAAKVAGTAEEARARAEVAELAARELREAEAALDSAEAATRELAQRVAVARQERDRLRAAMGEVRAQLEQLQAAEGQAAQLLYEAEKESEAAERTTLAARKQVGEARSALDRATRHRPGH